MSILQKVGRASITEVQRRRMFMSFIVCKDERNQNIIVGTGSPYFLTYNQAYIQVVKQEKVHISKAIMKAHSRGRMMPTEDDMITTRPVRLKLVDMHGLNINKVMDVYNLRI